jgi:hypothetical protein
VLGVDYTVPNWVEQYVREVMVEFTNKKIDRGGLEDLKRRSSRVGLDKMLPDVLLRADEKKP